MKDVLASPPKTLKLEDYEAKPLECWGNDFFNLASHQQKNAHVRIKPFLIYKFPKLHLPSYFPSKFLEAWLLTGGVSQDKDGNAETNSGTEA